MAIKIRKANEHGRSKLDWLDSSHGFSFNQYFDKNNMNFGKLIVFNDDHVKAGKGFGSHSHDNAEIFSFVIEGALEHKDSKGNHGIVKECEIQRISAGSGIVHSEINASKEKDVHFLQIWLVPRTLDKEPSYEQESFMDIKDKKGIFKLLSGKKENGLIYIDQDAEFSFAHLDKESIEIPIHNGMGLYVYVLDGSLEMGTIKIEKGDSAEITDMEKISINSPNESRFVVLETAL